MSATKEWLMSIEDTYWDQVVDIIKDSDNISEAMERAVSLATPMVPYLETEYIKDSVGEMWNDYN
jgi:hypothetical protein